MIGRRPKLDLALLAPSADATVAAAERAPRPVYVDGSWHDARVLERLALPVGARIEGPALFEQPDATVFLEPGMCAEVDGYGNLSITRGTA